MIEVPDKIVLPDIQEVYDRIVLHMNEKYDDTFSFRLPVNQRFGALYVRVTLNSEKYPGKKVYATCLRENENSVVITDNYLAIKYEQEVREYIGNILTDLYGDDVFFRYYPCSTISCPSFDDSTSLEEFISSKGACILFNAIVYMPKALFNKEKEDGVIRNKIIGSDICCSGTIYYTDNKNLLSEVGEDESLGVVLRSHPYHDRCEFIMSEKGVFHLFKWGVTNG